MSGIFQYEFSVSHETVDENGHVNNVAYVQWMQDAAVLHSDAAGGAEAMRSAGGTWVVRSHKIEYLRPAFAGDSIQALTWVVNFRRVRSLRQYKFVRHADDTILAKGETEWVFVDARTGRPRTIPDSVSGVFPLVRGSGKP